MSVWKGKLAFSSLVWNVLVPLKGVKLSRRRINTASEYCWLFKSIPFNRWMNYGAMKIKMESHAI